MSVQGDLSRHTVYSSDVDNEYMKPDYNENLELYDQEITVLKLMFIESYKGRRDRLIADAGDYMTEKQFKRVCSHLKAVKSMNAAGDELTPQAREKFQFRKACRENFGESQLELRQDNRNKRRKTKDDQ